LLLQIKSSSWPAERECAATPRFSFSQFFDFHRCELVETLWRRRGCDDRDDVLALKIARRGEVVGNIFALARRIW
jgi:hypothetical protein